MLQIDSLSITLSNKAILNELSLTVEEGTIMGILGRNGAGKTTLFRTIAADYKADSGTIFFNKKMRTKEDVAFLETEPHFYPYLKGKEYLELIQDKPQKIELWASMLDLPLDEYVDNYSTGMQKKLALAGAFLQNRPLMLLDEPFNGVDLESNAKIMAILNKTKASKSKTIIISSHILSTLTDTCDAIAVVKAGQILEVVEKPQFETLNTFFSNQDVSTMDALLEP